MELFKAIDFIIISQLIVFIVVISKRKQLRWENKLFILLYLGIILYCVLDRIQFAYHKELNEIGFPHLYHSAEPFGFLFTPVLYYYIRSVTQSNFRLKWMQLVHATPFFIALVYLLINYSFLPTATKFEALKEGATIYIPHHQSLFFNIIGFLQYGYLIVGFYLVSRYQKQRKHFVSTIKPYNIKPLYLLLFSYILVFTARTLIYGDSFEKIPVDIDFILYSSAIIFAAYKQPHLFVNSLGRNTPEDKNSKRSKEVNDIKFHMQNKKPYLNPDITLELLAKELDINIRKLSGIINTEFEENFFSFINKYRIEEAKKELSDPDNKSKTILEILYKVGFNNKSAFNRVFKEYTAQTPSEYRKQALKKA